LKILSQIIKKSIRKNDIAIRWGEEEFVVLLQNIPNLDTAKNIAENMKKQITKTQIDKVGNFSCSFGVSSYFIRESKDLNILFQKADELLYKAKKAGKNRVEI
jgi:diguanylate cyclase (GGDEF)-like protein